MSSTLHSSGDTRPAAEADLSSPPATGDDQPSRQDLLLRHRLRVVEDLWENVLEHACGPELLKLLQQLRQMCSPEGQAPTAAEARVKAVVEVVEALDLEDAIRASRAFALYFQLINIVEQHYEQRGQQQQYRAAYETSELAQRAGQSFFGAANGSDGEPASNLFQADLLSRSVADAPGVRKEAGTFHWLFPTLKRLNVPPQVIQNLIDQLDVRLVFTAHPTEIVRHTIRDKQRRIASILRQMDQAEESAQGLGLASSWEMEELKEQLTEEIRLWWRTDELHQFKPSVLDEVDYTLHYFQVVLFEALPQLYQRFDRAIATTFPELDPPRHRFCRFGSWVGADRDGNPSVTPEVTWKTACYQRNLVITKYIASVDRLVDLLSLSLHWSEVLPELLESLEQDQVKMPDVYDDLAIRYRQEPYRLKLAYIKQRLINTLDRSQRLYHSDPFADHSNDAVGGPIYRYGHEFLAELRLIQRNLEATGLNCQDLSTLICQVEIFGFNLAQLDLRQESSRHSDALDEIAQYLRILPQPYSELPEADKVAWLVSELQTRRPLTPRDLPFSDKTRETIATMHMVRQLHLEFGPDICGSYVISMSHTVSDLL
ncbi:phosphoenolpyruvate carboxylase, partial [filamentous cyanobacterium CCP4]